MIENLNRDESTLRAAHRYNKSMRASAALSVTLLAVFLVLFAASLFWYSQEDAPRVSFWLCAFTFCGVLSSAAGWALSSVARVDYEEMK